MTDTTLIDVMRELREKCELLCHLPYDQREPIRDRIFELYGAYLRLQIPEPELTEMSMRAWLDSDARLVRILLDGLDQHERQAGISITALDRLQRSLLKLEDNG